MRIIICLYCGKEKMVKAWNAKTCSGYCNLKNWRKNNRERNMYIKKNWRRRNGVLERGSIELRKKISNSLKGKIVGDLHPNWRGNDVGYRNLHEWVQRHLGKASYCENSPSHISTRYHWANLSGEYKRDLADWRQLCPSCNKTDGIKIADRFKKEAVWL